MVMFIVYNILVSLIIGYVREIKINIGFYVFIEQELFEIVDNYYLYIDFIVFEKDIFYIFEGQKLLFSL